MYKIRFEDRKRQPIYGHKYWFYLQDAVDDVPEYVVRWDNFVQYVVFLLIGMHEAHMRVIDRLASEYGLEQTYCGQFHQFFEEYQDVPEFKQLMERMNVVDANGESSMDEDQWEAASAYLSKTATSRMDARLTTTRRYLSWVRFQKAVKERLGLLYLYAQAHTCVYLYYYRHTSSL